MGIRAKFLQLLGCEKYKLGKILYFENIQPGETGAVKLKLVLTQPNSN